MVDRNWLNEFDPDESELAKLIESDSGEPVRGENSLPFDAPTFEPHTVVLATVVHIESDVLYLDIGYKGEVAISAEDLRLDIENLPKVGDKIEVGFLGFDASNSPQLTSRARVSFPRPYPEPMPEFEEGDRVQGVVVRQIRGGFLFNCGVHTFLPSSQVDVRRPPDLQAYVGQELECEILKVDHIRRNIVVSRRKILEAERAALAVTFLRRVKVGDIVTGVVVHIADFGAFVDLGGLDGLLHITDMSKESINHPVDLLAMGDKVEVRILHIHHDKDKVALALIRNLETTEE